MTRYCRAYVSSKSTGTLVPPSAATVVLPEQYCWEYILDQGSALFFAELGSGGTSNTGGMSGFDTAHTPGIYVPGIFFYE